MATATESRYLIDDDFRSLCRRLNATEYEQLEQGIIEAGGATDPIMVWGRHKIVLDGHHRIEICEAQKPPLPFQIRRVEGLKTREDALLWIIRHQRGRRNITDKEDDYLRGLQYETEKKIAGRPAVNKPEEDAEDGEDNTEATTGQRTAERIADEQQVSPRKVQNDAKYAQAIDAIRDIAGDAGEAIKTMILTGQIKSSAADVHTLAKMDQPDIKSIAKLILDGQVDSLKQAIQMRKDRLAQRAAKKAAEAEANGEAPAEPAKPAVPDPLGTPIPEHLQDFFENDHYGDAIKTLNRVMKTVKGMLPPASAYLELESAVEGLTKARNALANARPYAVCKACEGKKKGCPECRKSGFMPKWRVEEDAATASAPESAEST